MPYVRATPPERPESRRRLRRALATVALVATFGALLAVGGSAEPAAALTGHVTGTVFRDFNQNGVYNATAGTDGLTDAPLKGVTATVYNGAGTAVGTAVTNAAGAYDITVAPALPDGTPLRIQFSGYPAGFVDSFNGTANGTSVQFTTVGATGVNFALHRTTDYSRGSGAPIITAIQANGDPTLDTPANASVRSAAAITAILPTAAVNTAAPSAATTLATFAEVGAVWGVTIQSLGRVSGVDTYYVYAAAVVKRHSGWASRGIDGLYRLTVTVSATGVVTRTALSAYDLTVGGVNFGTLTRDLTDRSTGTVGIQSLDAPAFLGAGTLGIGGIAYDNGRLYVVNLNQKTILSYDVNNFATAPTVINPGLTADERPWAITVERGSLYLGVTNTTNVTTGAKVLARAVSGGIWTTPLTVPLNYTRGLAWAYDNTNPLPTTGQPQAQWHPWSTATSDANFETLWTQSTVPGQTWGFRAWAQPILSGLSFDDGGNLVLGFADRFSYQTGSDALWPNWNTTNRSGRNNITGMPVGDVLYAGRTAAGALAIENLGTAASGGTIPVTTPGLDNVNRAKGYGPDGASAGQTARQNEQHGGREFFEDSVRWDGRGGIDPAEGVVHDETSLGAVVSIAGTGQAVTTSFDPALTYNTGGNRFLSLTDGHSINGFDQYIDGAQYFGKGGGIGGVAALLADAPVEIGNRVWYDADLDGVQDPDEAAINGAPVQLWTANASGAPVAQLASTTTATVNGQPGTYFFRTADAASGGTTGFVKDADYVVVFPAGTGAVDLQWPTPTIPAGFSGMTWAQLQRTAALAAGSTTLTDSNPVVANGRALVTVGGMGENDHSIDSGWFGLSSYRLEKAVVGTPVAGATFTLDVATATNFRGDDRRWTSGAASTPIVDTLSYSLTAGQTVTTTEQLPYGYVLTFSESNMPGSAVAFAPFIGTDDTGRLVVTPTAAGSEARITATNSFTSITVTKALAPTATLPAGLTFPVEYTVDGGAAQTVQVAAGAGNAVTIPGVPWGSTVMLREPLTGPFSWGGLVWTTGTWAQGASPLVPDASGWVTVTAPSSTTALALTLTNHPYLPPTLPFTGGLGSDLFTIVGGLVLALALGLGVWQLVARRRRRGDLSPS